jgi:hypothetical protein
MAETTRLELATSGVTGRRSNQLNYASAGVDRTRKSSILRGVESKRFAARIDNAFPGF